jgi:hypothetical protein
MPLKIGPKVILRPITRAIIEQIEPYMPPNSEVIGGFLDDDGQIFKLNYHWALLMRNIERLINRDRSVAKLPYYDPKVFVEMRSRLLRVAPPNKPYLKAASPIQYPDSSSNAKILRRYTVVSKVKQDFKAALKSVDTSSISSVVSDQFKLAGDGIKMPGTSAHGTGYALDIKGNGKAITDACKRLGAWVKPECHHIHVEFRHGVNIGGRR